MENAYCRRYHSRVTPSPSERALSDVGAAVIGSGFIGTVHIEGLRRIGVQVRGLLGSSEERGAERAARLGVPRAYRDLDELLADDSVDVVHVTSPNREHFPQVKAILAAGKHVNCEKPLAMDVGESAALVQLAVDAASRGKVAAVNFNIRFYPLNQHLRAGHRRRRPRRRATDHRPLLPGLAAATTLTGTGASNRRPAAGFAPSATSARTGST